MHTLSSLLIKGLLKIPVNYITRNTLIKQACKYLTKSQQFRKTWLPIHKTMLQGTDNKGAVHTQVLYTFISWELSPWLYRCKKSNKPFVLTAWTETSIIKWSDCACQGHYKSWYPESYQTKKSRPYLKWVSILMCCTWKQSWLRSRRLQSEAPSNANISHQYYCECTSVWCTSEESFLVYLVSYHYQCS